MYLEEGVGRRGLRAVGLAAAAILAFVPAGAQAADRMVLGELFTSIT